MDEYQAQIATLIRASFYKREDEEPIDEKSYFEELCKPRCVRAWHESQLIPVSLESFNFLKLLVVCLRYVRINMRKVNRSKDLELLILFKEVMKMDLLSHLFCQIKEPEIDHHRLYDGRRDYQFYRSINISLIGCYEV
ncbi:hypothetical protein Hanom_Chr00s000003g01602851 [Helianthus anomalus]